MKPKIELGESVKYSVGNPFLIWNEVTSSVGVPIRNLVYDSISGEIDGKIWYPVWHSLKEVISLGGVLK